MQLLRNTILLSICGFELLNLQNINKLPKCVLLSSLPSFFIKGDTRRLRFPPPPPPPPSPTCAVQPAVPYAPQVSCHCLSEPPDTLACQE
ncbi:hypothetical protein ABVT39_016234 [Epinephelus coioides]